MTLKGVFVTLIGIIWALILSLLACQRVLTLQPQYIPLCAWHQHCGYI